MSLDSYVSKQIRRDFLQCARGHFFSINSEGSHVMVKRHRIQYGKDNQYRPTS
jgi:hypothetical protein